MNEQTRIQLPEDLPIFTAIARQNVPAVQALVAAGADLQVRGTCEHTRKLQVYTCWPISAGYTPLEMANGHIAITRELIAAEYLGEQEQPPDEADWER